jgi:hypothetical protein
MYSVLWTILVDLRSIKTIDFISSQPMILARKLIIRWKIIV